MVNRLLQRTAQITLSFFAILFAPFAHAHSQYNLPLGVTPISQEIYHLHMTIFIICCVIGLAVFSVMIYSLIFHRKSRGAVPAEFHEHPLLEVLWAIIPFLILVVMAVPATKVLFAMDNTDESDITIKVTGYQWKWQYQYLDQGISFFSNLSTPPDQISGKEEKDEWYLLEVDNPVIVPIHKKIRLLVTANDVIHSWWVPDFGIKRDAIPGFIHEAWMRIERPGTYRGQCAELCGMGHGYMPIVVKAVTETEFNAWVKSKTDKLQEEQAAAEKQWSKAELLDVGKKTYERICAVCHKSDGLGQPPVFPALKGSSIAVSKPISRHILRVLNGVPGTAMQAFSAQLTDAEIAAVVTYERNSWGNNTGDTVQPAEVKALRTKQ